MNKKIITSSAIGIILLMLGSTINITHALTSPKELLLTNLEKYSNHSQTAKKTVISLRFSNIKTANPSSQQIINQYINKKKLLITVLSNTKNNQLEINYQLGGIHGSAWLSKQKDVFALQNTFAILEKIQKNQQSLLPVPMNSPSTSTIPMYLYSQGIPFTMSQLNTHSPLMNASINLDTILINGIPSHYFHRTSLTSLSISFTQRDVPLITDDVIKSLYAHKNEVKHDLLVMKSYKAYNSIPFQGLFQKSEANEISAVNQSLKQLFRTVGVLPTSLTVSENGKYESLTSGIVLHTKESTGTIHFTIQSSSSDHFVIQFPVLTKQNSESLQQFIRQQQTSHQLSSNTSINNQSTNNMIVRNVTS